VVDARDPLRYFSEDLMDYAQSVSPTKRSMLLLNKADLLTEECRAAWADYFDTVGVAYSFWSARNAVEEAKQAKLAAKVAGATCFLLPK
jgi:large subunit GTPase 1